MSTSAPVIDTRDSFTAALRWGFDQALAQSARSLCLVDPTYEHWPLDEVDVLQTLSQWARLPGRQLILLAARFDEVPRRQPRFTAWRKDWAHSIQALQAPPEFASDLPTLMLDDRRLCVHLIDAVSWRGRAAQDPRARLRWQEKIDVVLQRSEAAFAASTLGL